MQTDYRIEDLTHQDSETVTYYARKKNGIPYTLTRLNFPDKVLEPLHQGHFKLAFARISDWRHGCLRPVVDGGLDEIDQIPWVATRWWDGKLLSEQIKNKTLTRADIARIQFHGETLIRDLGEVGGALSIDPRTIVTTRSLEGEKVTTFEFDYSRWFSDWARGQTPGANDDALDNLQNLIFHLEDALEEFEEAPVPVQQVATPTNPAPVLLTLATESSQPVGKAPVAILPRAMASS